MIMENTPEKLKEILDSSDLEKHGNFSFQSSSTKTYKGRLTWSVNESDLNNVSSFGISEERELSIGPLDYCKMKLRIFPKGKTENSRNFISFDVVFKEKLPNGSYFYSSLSLIDGIGNVLKSIVETDSGKNVDVIQFDDVVPTSKLNDFLNEKKKLTIMLFLKITCSEYVSHSDGAEYSVNESYIVKLPTKKCIDKMPEDLKLKLNKKDEVMTNKALLASIFPALQMVCKAIPADEKELELGKNLQKLDIPMFERIMNFALTENMTFLNFADVCNLYNAANAFDLIKLIDLSSAYLSGNLSRKNVYMVQTLSQAARNVPLAEACIDYIKSCNTEELAEESMLKN